MFGSRHFGPNQSRALGNLRLAIGVPSVTGRYLDTHLYLPRARTCVDCKWTEFDARVGLESRVFLSHADFTQV